MRIHLFGPTPTPMPSPTPNRGTARNQPVWEVLVQPRQTSLGGTALRAEGRCLAGQAQHELAER